MFRIMFNTSFIQHGNYIKAGKMELSPEDIRKDGGKYLPHNFLVYIFFDNFCDVCNPQKTEIKDLCNKCRVQIGDQTIKEWLEVKQLIDVHSYPTEEEGKLLLPGVPQELINSTLSKKLQFNPNYYRILTTEEIEAAENQNPTEEEEKQESGGRASEMRKQSQVLVSFPLQEEDISKDQYLLGNMNDIKEESSSSDGGTEKSASTPSDIG